MVHFQEVRRDLGRLVGSRRRSILPPTCAERRFRGMGNVQSDIVRDRSQRLHDRQCRAKIRARQSLKVIRRVVTKFRSLSTTFKMALGTAVILVALVAGYLWYRVGAETALGGAAAGLAAAWGWLRRRRKRASCTAIELAEELAERKRRDAEDSRREAELAGRRRIDTHHQDALRRAENDAARMHPRDVLDSVTSKK